MAMAVSAKDAHSNMFQPRVVPKAKVNAKVRAHEKEKERPKERTEAQGSASRWAALQMRTGTTITFSVLSAIRSMSQMVVAYARTTSGMLSAVQAEMHGLSSLLAIAMRPIRRVLSLLWTICNSRSTRRASQRTICTAVSECCYLLTKVSLSMQLI